MWLRTSATTNSSVVNYGQRSAGRRFGLVVIRGHAYFVGEFRDLEGTRLVNDDQWHHVAITYDGAAVRLFVDGVADGSMALALDTTSAEFAIGENVGSRPREPFVGTISDARVYSRVLSTADLTALRVNDSVTVRQVSSGLVAWYPLRGDGREETDRCSP